MQDADSRTGQWRPSRLTRFVAFLVVLAAMLVVVVLFIADNFVIVEVRLFRWHWPVRLAWTILLSVAIGAVLGAIATETFQQLRRRRNRR